MEIFCMGMQLSSLPLIEPVQYLSLSTLRILKAALIPATMHISD